MNQKKDNKMNWADPDHFKNLNECFQEQIGVSMDLPQSLNIFNFDEKLIAKGYDRVVTTWQGMFWEHSREDICFRNLRKDGYSVDGIESWKADGVQVFRLTKPDKRRKPRAHRFAVNPPRSLVGSCNPLKLGRWYTHVYQTKVLVNQEMKTIQSKPMAQELKRICGDSYCPRKYDLVDRRTYNVTNHLKAGE